METKSGQLIITRHGETEWNKLGIWTGVTDVHLSEHGFESSKKVGLLLKNIRIDHIFISAQIRTYETLLGIEESLNKFDIPITIARAVNERDYGDYTGKNKFEVQKQIGEEAYWGLRRGWDYPVPNGETLKTVYERTIPYYREKILEKISSGKNVLLVAHGNSIRSLIKYIESISDEDIGKVEMIFEEILIYDLDKDGRMLNKKILNINK